MAYEELIKELREVAKEKYEYENRATGMSILLDEAADAIDELEVQISELEERILTRS
jgi:phage shock protein A